MLFYSLKELRSGCVAQDDSSGPSLSPDGLPSISLSLDSQSLKTHTHRNGVREQLVRSN
jgi:hypothetical protein